MLKYESLAEEWSLLNADGWSLRKIASEYNTTHATIARTLNKMNIPYTKWHNNEFSNITNTTFGIITAIKPVCISSDGCYIWECFCKCNPDIKFLVNGSDLRRGRKKHCGCSFPRKNDITNKPYGNLTAIRDSGSRMSGSVLWECKCVCGKIIKVPYGDLESGHTKSCGCSRPKGKDHPRWNGGNSEVKTYVRNTLTKWKNDSLKKHRYKCVVTGIKSRKLEIHHLTKPFHLIFEESLKLCGLKAYEKIGDYTNKELGSLTETCITLHEHYGLGVPLTKKIHKEFHKQYGYETNLEDFDKFRNALNS